MVWSGDYWPLSSADFKDLREKSTSFTDFGAYTPRHRERRRREAGGGVERRVHLGGAARVGVRPELGRWLETTDDEKARPRWR